ncbi:tRNA (pseudouridine(54)-N(1))-methyltransferase TrmY [Aquicella lusitana]|uniref:Putative pseudouridine methyltransferase n=1 Tax=Aquicella lusitana TaxID=254246 RepID=A0A370G228_9COXI|nr:tRNA (pseudouridine(54)-N(1))-methyltransferase TrmY [Aquicella lusitana]RDI36674.1 tRNA (pseudouridine54-N1)-methyltransferase [Aquicella lusitana]VVC72542.1 Putative pseudouridine methyltransferase [Aquicella lusitana]
MRTFVIRARKGTTRWEQVRAQIGTKGHFEVIAHSVMNAFFVSNGFRDQVEIYIILDSAEDFPRTIKLSGSEGLSIAGFHEEAVLELVEKALRDSPALQKNETRTIAPGLQISGFGFEKLASHLLETRTVYLLDRKGEDIRSMALASNPVFILSDHLAMPKKSVKGLIRHGLKTISLGKKMLFASQCVTILNYELDRAGCR